MLSESLERENLSYQNSPQVGHFEFDQVEICHGISLPETAHFVR